MSDSHEEIILKGAAVWNKWRKQNKGPLHFTKPFWYNCPCKDGKQGKGMNKLDFCTIELSGASIHSAFAEGLNIQDAAITDCLFEEGDFSRANFSNTIFKNTRFNKTILTDAVFNGASFINCNLNRVNLTNAEFCLKEITETVVYGVSAWDLKTCDEMRQSRLIIERTYDLYSDIIAAGKIPLMVDDIELAQFIYYLSDHKKVRNLLNILNARGVLLLGRFRDGGLERLYSMAAWLKKRGYTPMIYDFERPDILDNTETVVTMAGLSKMILADLSGPSVPHELHAIFSSFRKPIIAYCDNNAYSMFSELKRKNPYVFEIRYSDNDDLFMKMEANVKYAEEAYFRIIQELAEA
ncbi:MAG: pentapeptide repeat-containing protein [Spirochaetales bacterium]|nr:pentapeptide repeat-containing protein [Spirochaetales bacterium]